MPAVSQTLLLLAAWSDERPLVRVPAGRVDRAGALLLAVVFTAAAALCMQTSVIPVQRAGLLMLQGDRAAAGATKIDFYQQAAAADRFSPEPWRKVARVWLSQRRWQSAIEALSKAAARDPLSFQDLRALGLAYQAWGTESQQAEHLARAVEFLEAAVERYPASSQLWAELALARFQAGQPEKARQAAERALQLDRINRECGHRDRYLDRDFTDQLKLILERTMSQ